MVDFAAPAITPPKINPSEITLTSSRERERRERIYHVWVLNLGMEREGLGFGVYIRGRGFSAFD